MYLKKSLLRFTLTFICLEKNRRFLLGFIEFRLINVWNLLERKIEKNVREYSNLFFRRMVKKPLENHSDFIHPGIQLENQERAKVLFRAIDLLSEQQRTAYILHKIDQVSYNEIAEIMELSLSAVESVKLLELNKI